MILVSIQQNSLGHLTLTRKHFGPPVPCSEPEASVYLQFESDVSALLDRLQPRSRAGLEDGYPVLTEFPSDEFDCMLGSNNPS